MHVFFQFFKAYFKCLEIIIKHNGLRILIDNSKKEKVRMIKREIIELLANLSSVLSKIANGGKTANLFACKMFAFLPGVSHEKSTLNL